MYRPDQNETTGKQSVPQNTPTTELPPLSELWRARSDAQGQAQARNLLPPVSLEMQSRRSLQQPGSAQTTWPSAPFAASHTASDPPEHLQGRHPMPATIPDEWRGASSARQGPQFSFAVPPSPASARPDSDLSLQSVKEMPQRPYNDCEKWWDRCIGGSSIPNNGSHTIHAYTVSKSENSLQTPAPNLSYQNPHGNSMISEPSEDQSEPDQSTLPSNGRHRAAIACLSCRKRKIKCVKTPRSSSCRNCTQYDTECDVLRPGSLDVADMPQVWRTYTEQTHRQRAAPLFHPSQAPRGMC